MPRVTVPTIDEQTVGEVGSRVQSSAGAFGGVAADAGARAAQAGSKLSGEMFDIQMQIRDRQDTQDALDGDTQLKDYTLERQREVSQMLGGNARGASLSEGEALGKRREEIAKGMNPRARNVYLNRATATSQAFIDGVAKHEYTQNRVAFANSITANLNAGQAAVLADPNNVNKTAQHYADIDSSAKALQKAEGWDDKYRDAFVLQRKTMMHVGLIEGMVDGGNASAAKKWFDSNKDDIDPLKRSSVEKLFKDGVLREKGNAFADSVQPSLDRAATPEQLTALSQAARAGAREEKDPFIRKAQEDAVETRITQAEKSMNSAFVAADRAGWDHFNKTGGLPPQTVLNAMVPQHAASLVAHANAVQRRGEVQVNDDETMSTVWKAIGAGNIGEVNFDLLQPKLNPATLNHFRAMQAADAANPHNKAVIQSAQSAVNRAVSGIGLDGKENKEARETLAKEVMDAVSAKQQEKQKTNPKARLDDAEIQDVVTQYVVKGTTSGWFGTRSDAGLGVNLTDADAIGEFRPDANGLKRIRAALERMPGDTPLTDDDLVNRYRNFLRKRAGLAELAPKEEPEFEAQRASQRRIAAQKKRREDAQRAYEASRGRAE